MIGMAKKKKLTLYAEINAETKRRLERLAEHEGRKIARELQFLLDEIIPIAEKRAKLPPLPADEEVNE